MEYKPSDFIKPICAEWQSSSIKETVAACVIRDLRNGDQDLHFWRLDIPKSVPARYHARMQSAWREFLIRFAFQYNKSCIGYAERFKLAQKTK